MQVLELVVALDAVDVMNPLLFGEEAPDLLLHDEYVLGDDVVTATARMVVRPD